MTNTVTLTQPAYKELLDRLTRLEKMVITLLEKFEREPTYGSSDWWEWSDKQALKDIKAGDYKAFSSAKEMTKYLKTL